MKVKDLIKELSKLPKNLDIYSADHDHGKFETNSKVNHVYLIDKKEMDEFENDEFTDGRQQPFKDTPNKYVVVRPN